MARENQESRRCKGSGLQLARIKMIDIYGDFFTLMGQMYTTTNRMKI